MDGDEGKENDAYEQDLPVIFVPPKNFLSLEKQNGRRNSYFYEPNMPLKGLTIEALPSEENYRRLSQMALDSRPTLEELMSGQQTKKVEEDPDSLALTKPGSKAVKFGWIEGVFMRCLLNIWGVMLFLRLSWVVGQAGLIQGLCILTLCNSVTFITALSMSAVATNGQIAGGGVYYMISRALGPEFGGGIGLMFTIANSISVATYTLGFVDNLLDLIYDVTDFTGIVADNENRTNDLRLIGAPVVLLLLILAIVGMTWVTRVQKILLVMLIVAQIDMVVGSFLSDSAYVMSDERRAKGFTGWSMDTMWTNLDAQYKENSSGNTESFMSVFGVFFTAVTGIVAGANLSGDLKDPSSAIPKGTLSAIFITYFSYSGFCIAVAFNFLPLTSGNVEEYLNDTGLLPRFDNCTEEANALREILNLTETTCRFGSSVDQKVMTYLSGTGYLVYLGCYGATLSSAIASLEGAPRVLQAVAKDRIYPKLEFFAKGSGPSNAPLRGSILVFCIAFGCLMIAELNTIGSLASNFFLAAYGLINFSVFHSSMTKSPGWRPSFKFYNKWISLLGAFACVALMFLMDWPLAIATIALMAILYGFMLYLKPEISWGSSADALVFLNALNNSYALNNLQEHIKTYRPKILLLSGNPAHRQPLVDFSYLLTKKMSLLICTHILPEKSNVGVASLKETVGSWLKDHNIKSFYNIIYNKSFSEGVLNSIMLSGLGKLSPNMVLMGYQNDKTDLRNIEEYYKTIIISLENKFSIGILRLKNGTDYSSIVAVEETNIQEFQPKTGIVSKKLAAEYRGKDGRLLPKAIVEDIQQFRVKRREGYIDVWWLYDDGGLTMLLPHILQTRKQFSGCKMRVFTLSNRPEDFDNEAKNFATLLAKFRIEFSKVTVIPDITKNAEAKTKAEFDNILAKYPSVVDKAVLTANSATTNMHLRTAELLREHSINAELIVVTLPLPRKIGCPPVLYMAWLEMMTQDLPPVLLTRGNQSSVLTYYS